MRNIFRAAFAFTISLLILCVGTASAELVIDQNYQLVSSIRVGRTAYDYTYQVNITNNGSDVQNVTAAVSSGSLNTTIIDGDVNFGDIPAGSTVAGTDTFIIRQNRSYAFDPNSLTWNIQFELAAQIIPPEGGEIQGEGGIVLIVPGGATSDPIPVTITVLQENDLGATPPPNTTFLGGAAIDMGQNELMDNADISMPAPDGVPDGAEVYLAKLVEYAGQTMFQMVDTAIVQNGIIVSQDPAFPGVTTSGSYCFLLAQNVGWVEGQVTNINSGIAVPEAVVTISGGYWLDIADDSGYYSLPAWAGNFIVNAFDDQTGDFGEKQGFMPNDGATVLINVEIGESSGPTQSTLVNGNFEDGLTGWVLSGAGSVVSSLGPISPYEGNYMAMISSGSGAVGGSSSALEQSFTVPSDATTLTIHYNFISEEYPEFVGSQYNDVFNATLHTPDGSIEIAFNSVNTAVWQSVSGIDFPGGDSTCGQTGWITESIDVSQWAGTDDTLTLTVHDVGDTIYDTVVLIDDIELISSLPTLSILPNVLLSITSESYSEDAAHESVYARICNLQNNSITAEDDIDNFMKDHANSQGSGREPSGKILITHLLDNTWGDNLNVDSSFNTVYDASPGLDNDGVFEVVSVTDEGGSLRGTNNTNAYYFSYDGLNDWNAGAITLTQWVDYLEIIKNTYGKIGRLTIFAHGSSGRLHMSDSFILTTNDLQNNTTSRNELSRLRHILSNEAHILLFSCRVAKDALFDSNGTDFVQELANLTGATIHANEDYTGNYNDAWFGDDTDWSLDVVAIPKNATPVITSWSWDSIPLGDSGYSSTYARISNLKNGESQLVSGTIDETFIQASNSGAFQFTTGEIVISNMFDSEWYDLLGVNEHFNSAWYPNDILSDKFEVISQPDKASAPSTTTKTEAYFFSYDESNVLLKDWVDYLENIKLHFKKSIDTLVVYAHGNIGLLCITDTCISTFDIKNDGSIRDELKRLKNILSPNGHILLFSCNTAQDIDFIKELSLLTGAYVHANSNLTSVPENEAPWFSCASNSDCTDWQLDLVCPPDGNCYYE